MLKEHFMPHIDFHDASYSHFDGTPVIARTTVSLSGKIGIVGRNGSGKTTLLRLIAGELTPSSGSVRCTDIPVHVPQNLTLNVSDRLADVMGIASKLAALRSIQAGSADAADFDVLGEDWDLEERALAMLHSLGLAENLDGSAGALERGVGGLSGGEVMAAALAGAFARRPAVMLLDEPTNNLDSHARRWLCRTIGEWPGCVLVVSHDAELLERMDAVARLRRGVLTLYGGPFSRYLALSRAESEAADRRVGEAEARLRGEKRHLAADQTRAAHSGRQGAAAAAKSRFPTAAVHLRRSRAEKSAARRRTSREGRIEEAELALRRAKAAACADDHITVELPETEMPAGGTVLELKAGERVFLIVGPERVALSGRNGSGKTTLLKTLLGRASLPDVRVRRIVPEVACLPQRLDCFDDAGSAIDNLLRAAPDLGVNGAYAVLARFLLKNERARQTAGTLSGGERLRLALACLLSVRPAPRLILLDEPTNNLDHRSVSELIEAMNRFRGAIIAVSHDREFLAAIGAERLWVMEALRLTEGTP